MPRRHTQRNQDTRLAEVEIRFRTDSIGQSTLSDTELDELYTIFRRTVKENYERQFRKPYPKKVDSEMSLGEKVFRSLRW